MDTISIVLTLKINANLLGSDLERVKKILLPSFVKYFNCEQINRLLVIVPPREQQQVTNELAHFRKFFKITVINEENVLKTIPGWQWDQIVHGFLVSLGKSISRFKGGRRLSECLTPREGWRSLRGWQRQQLLKIFAARLIDTKYYMTVDSDLCLMRPTDLKTLFPDRKAIWGRDKVKSKHEWWVASATVLDISLNLDQEGDVISVTPQLLSTEVAVALADYLIAKAKEKNCRTVFEYLAVHRSWTEYTLYWLFLLEFHKRQDYYTDQIQDYRMYSSLSVWFREHAVDLKKLRERIDLAFQRQDALFMVVQSACIPLTEYYEAIKRYV